LGKSLLLAAGIQEGDFVSVRLLDSGDIRVRPVKEPRAADPHLNEDQKVEEEPW
jgi:hypothetical protein